MPPKVFFIGASKMCTSSISDALKEKGKRVYHNARFGIYSHLDVPDKKFFESFDYFLDGNFHDFTKLDKWFPDALFVVLDREPTSWLPSLFNWVHYVDKRHMKGEWLVMIPYQLILGRRVYRRIMVDFLVYKSRVSRYFKDSSKMIHLDIEREGEEGWKRLSDFIGLELKPMWSNIQVKKEWPVWLPSSIDSAKKRAEKIIAQDEFPGKVCKQEKILVWIHSILLTDFIKYRHLFKNIEESFSTGFFSFNSYRLFFQSIFKFIRLIFLLWARVILVKNHKFCPYIY